MKKGTVLNEKIISGLVLMDIKHINNEFHKEYTMSENISILMMGNMKLNISKNIFHTMVTITLPVEMLRLVLNLVMAERTTARQSEPRSRPS